MTTLVYNDVVLRDCLTSTMQQTVEYDESGTDVMFSRFKIRVSSTLVAIRAYTGVNQFGIHTPKGTTVVQRMHDVQSRLSESRKDFWLLVDDCVQDERQGTGDFDAPTLDQPLLIACGEAYTETMEDIEETPDPTPEDPDPEPVVVGQRLVRTELEMLPHPFSTNSTTRRYGPGLDGMAPETFPKHLCLDCNNGPRPTDVRITEIFGGRSFRVEFEIEICLKICTEEFGTVENPDSKPAVFGDITGDNRVLSNRWSIDESIDSDWATKRVLQGTLRVANETYFAHGLRYLCVPPLRKGFRRVRQSFVTDATGLSLKYRIEDQQMHAAPPPPAIDFSGHHAESGTGSMGVVKTGDFRIRLVGPPGVDKQQLIAAAFKVALNRIKGLVPRDAVPGEKETEYSTILKNATVVDVIDKPIIELTLRVRYNNDSYKALSLQIESMGTPLDMGDDAEGEPLPGEPETNHDLIDGYSPQAWPVPLPYDSQKPAGVLRCYLQHPCSVWHDIPEGYTPKSEGLDAPVRPNLVESEPADSPEATNREEPLEFPEDDGEFRPVSGLDIQGKLDFYSFPYTFISLEQRYEFYNGWSGLPLATTASGGRSVALVKLHKTSACRVLVMKATRNGRPPLIPAPDEDITDENSHREVLKEYTITALEPKVGPNGTAREYSVKTEYVYLLEVAPANDEKLRGVSSPIDRFTPDSNHLDLTEIIDDGGIIQWKNGVTVTYPPPTP